MIPFNPTAREPPLIQQKLKTREIFPRKISENFTLNSSIFSTFILLSRFCLRIPSINTELQYFKKEATAEINSNFNFNEDHEMETQPIFLSSDESEIVSPCSSTFQQLPNKVPDTNNAISQLIAAQHEQMSLSGIPALQCPTTPPNSLISDDDNDEVLTTIFGNPAQLLPILRIANLSLSNYANKQHPSQIRRNLRPQKSVGIQTIFVPTISLTNRHQSH